MKHGKPSPGAPKVRANSGKGGGSLMLPSRRAVAKLLKGPPGDRTLLDFGEMVPTGKNAPQTYPAIIKMGQRGPKLG